MSARFFVHATLSIHHMTEDAIAANLELVAWSSIHDRMQDVFSALAAICSLRANVAMAG